MARTNRAQFSLIFDDNDMFDKFVEPYKKSKELQPLVLKLLSLYYYDESMRGMVDSLSAPEASNSSTNVVGSALDNIKETFFLLDTSIKSAKGSLDEGVKNLVKVCDMGMAKTQEDDKHFEKFGSLNSPLILRDIQKQQEQEAVEIERLKQESEEKKQISDHDMLENLGTTVSNLSDTVALLCKSLMQNGGTVPQNIVGISSAPAVKEVVTPVNIEATVTESISSSSDSADEEGQNHEEHGQEENLDGTNAIQNLLKGW